MSPLSILPFFSHLPTGCWEFRGRFWGPRRCSTTKQNDSGPWTTVWGRAPLPLRTCIRLEQKPEINLWSVKSLRFEGCLLQQQAHPDQYRHTELHRAARLPSSSLKTWHCRCQCLSLWLSVWGSYLNLSLLTHMVYVTLHRSPFIEPSCWLLGDDC